MPIIDCQSHVFPPAYAELLTRNRGRLQTSGGDGVYHLNYWDVQRFVLTLDDYSIERKLAALRYAVDFMPTDRLLFGSDHPWVAIETLLDLVNALALPAAERARLLGGNAAELFRIA